MPVEDGSAQELDSLDPQKRELLEARFLGPVRDGFVGVMGGKGKPNTLGRKLCVSSCHCQESKCSQDCIALLQSSYLVSELLSMVNLLKEGEYKSVEVLQK